MKEILGKALSVRELLKGVKYSIDYYQREYKWESKQIRELVDDLSGKFLEEYQPSHPRSQVSNYPHYFLGSIIISKKDNTSYIVDGQQRLTSLTLLLIYLHNVQKDREPSERVNIDELIVSERYGEKSFNLEIDERTQCMESLFDMGAFDPDGSAESVENLVRRYEDIDEALPDEIRNGALPYFMDWLQENVHLVEITAYSDEDAYTIFETMNDRGLSLSPTDMLKGYLLANIIEPMKRADANELWRTRILELSQAGKEVEPDFFKAWLRSQYATRIRERKRGAQPEDFDRIGTEFHRWLRDASESLMLCNTDDFYQFIMRHFDFYSRQYMTVVKASHELVGGYEHIKYNADHGLTLQNLLLLAPLCPDDSEDIVRVKLAIVAKFVDILITRRLWNFRSIAYNTLQYAVFLVMRSIRGADPVNLAQKLTEELGKETEVFSTNDRLRIHQQNRWYLHRMLARITDYIEVKSGGPSRYEEYVNYSGRNRYEVEHIWADKLQEHTEEFDHPTDFAEYRNRIGALLLLPKSFNASYGDLPYEEKLPHYNTQNLLARSLHSMCYEHNPGFLRFKSNSAFPFRPHEQFMKKDIDERGELYRKIAEQIWNPAQLLKEAAR